MRIGLWFPSINQRQTRILFRMLIYNQKNIEPTSKISRHNQYAFSPMMPFRIFISFILIMHLRHWLLRLNFVLCCIGTFSLIQPKNQANQLYQLLNIKLVCLTSYRREQLKQNMLLKQKFKKHIHHILCHTTMIANLSKPFIYQISNLFFLKNKTSKFFKNPSFSNQSISLHHFSNEIGHNLALTQNKRQINRSMIQFIQNRI
jgi:hypothetical protein